MSTEESRYDPKQIEPKWQAVWRDERTWHVTNKPDDRPKSYVLEMLPYPSGEPHMGHLKVYSVGDALAHFRRRNGMRVLHPMGYDSFGLPAENYAIKTGRHPRESTEDAIAEFRRQFETWGVSIDWDREFGTHQPEYYRWTQWIFLKLFESGLAYRKEAAVKWCPNDQTVLANEQVVDGACERCGAEVEVKQLNQWFFKITAYAERLLDDFTKLESWPENVITMQRNWIGRSEGAEVVFSCEDLEIDYPVFTTRPDTLFGATFFVMAPEHPDVMKLAAGTEYEAEVRGYINRAVQLSTRERGADDNEKTGVPLGRTVTNPVNGERIPMYVSDYVLMEYGTGAIMAVPAHDQRDYEFARKYGVAIRQVIAPADDADVPDDAAYVSGTDSDVLVGSGEFDGMTAVDAKRKITDWLERETRGRAAVNYKLRDWLVSRQRYWGCPIPIVHCEQCGMVPVSEAALPVELPDVEDYMPKGQSPLASASEWVETSCPQCHGPARRETDTMDTFVDSSWYFMRYCDPRNEHEPWHRAVLNQWMPVDNYIGGVEHAILHLMYARFFTKALHDLGLVGPVEPFQNLFTQGMITRDGAKMSKSRGNVINPSAYVEKYGADTTRCYILFIGPPDQDADWTDEGVEGVHRFLSRIWRLGEEVAARTDGSFGVDAPAADEALAPEAETALRKAHWAIDKVTRDIEGRFAFNTAIAAVMELVNEIYKVKDAIYAAGAAADAQALRFASATAASLLWPFAPHVGAEIYERLGGGRVWDASWPLADERFLKTDRVTLAVQVNGKLRDQVEVDADAGDEAALAAAKASERVLAHTAGMEIVKEIVVPGKLVNLVVR